MSNHAAERAGEAARYGPLSGGEHALRRCLEVYMCSHTEYPIPSHESNNVPSASGWTVNVASVSCSATYIAVLKYG